mgnify:CR=1 FL=1
MNIPFSGTVASIAVLVGVVLLGPLTGCSDKPKPAVATEAEHNQLAKRFIEPNQVLGALLIGKNGEILPVDADGKPVKPCRLPGAADDSQDKLDLPDCNKTRDTTIRDIRSLALVTHSGSTCITYGGGIFGGKKMPSYQICYP